MKGSTIMQSILIVGGNLEKRENKAHEIEKLSITDIDTLIVNGENSIGIDKVRDLEKWASRKPHSSQYKKAIIHEAEKLTYSAQNALLKILEEPPANTLIVLTAPQETSLLSTIISRCKIIKLKPEIEIVLNKPLITQLLNYLITLLNSGVGERIKKAETLSKTQENALTFLDQLIFLLRDLLFKQYQISSMQATTSIDNIPDFPNISDLPKILRKAQKTKFMIKKNVNLKLCLENFFLDLPLLK
ncbi:hypothetical protein ISS85_00285 [Candidatus Microgenomates bacterium]|nr:hypothetical protein [Candidatus Microgenomates bacterium]